MSLCEPKEQGAQGPCMPRATLRGI